ncbi:DUF3907 family protein [Marinicrinis lubricantis]|uniref:DUF3907 family protein n=1 Tax=Marinicrinis lubricantis TaxID=2086470 RepID=A0ABW1IUL5_9BACL
MPVQNVKALCESTKEQLMQAMENLEHFLNHYSITSFDTNDEPEMTEFYTGFLSDLRHLLVYCEDYYEKLGILLRRPTFNEEQSEKVLYHVYHQCINSFFYPKHECYSEDGRYAYTGQDAIRFRKKPQREARDITLACSKIFEELRENLAYYESDYVNRLRMQGEKL